MVVSKKETAFPPRVFSVEYKEAAVRRMATESPAALARELDVRPKLLYYWQRQVKQGRMMNRRGRVKREVGPTAIQVDQMGELERLVGRQQRELAFFRGALRRVEALSLASNDAGATPSLLKFGR